MTTVNVNEPIEQAAARLAAENNLTEGEARALLEEINRLLREDTDRVRTKQEAAL